MMCVATTEHGGFAIESQTLHAEADNIYVKPDRFLQVFYTEHDIS
jgi:hypothetical protein